MSYTAADFLGTYQITQGSYYLNDDDPRKDVNPENKVVLSAAAGGAVDLTVVNQFGNAVLGPLACVFDASLQCLVYSVRDYQETGQPLVSQVSLYVDAPSAYRSVYGAMIFGDPENVGVWGGNIQPPP